MYKTIFIGGINRSGGSLLARLFDGHPHILSYPTEIPFPHSQDFYKIFENYAGILDAGGQAKGKLHIPNIPALRGIKIYTAFITLKATAPSSISGISNTFLFTIQ